MTDKTPDEQLRELTEAFWRELLKGALAATETLSLILSHTNAIVEDDGEIDPDPAIAEIQKQGTVALRLIQAALEWAAAKEAGTGLSRSTMYRWAEAMEDVNPAWAAEVRSGLEQLEDLDQSDAAN